VSQAGRDPLVAHAGGYVREPCPAARPYARYVPCSSIGDTRAALAAGRDTGAMLAPGSGALYCPAPALRSLFRLPRTLIDDYPENLPHPVASISSAKRDVQKLQRAVVDGLEDVKAQDRADL
jgi:hypothetical protein